MSHKTPPSRDDAALDELLALSEMPAPSSALIGRILAGAPRPRRSWWHGVFAPLPAWAPVAALSVALFAGLGTGAALPPPTDEGLELAYAAEIDALIDTALFNDLEGTLQ